MTEMNGHAAASRSIWTRAAEQVRNEMQRHCAVDNGSGARRCHRQRPSIRRRTT